MGNQSILMIDRGDPSSLAALATLSRPEQVILWFPWEPDAARSRRFEVVQDHARLFGISRLLSSPSCRVGVSDLPPPEGLFQSRLLLDAIAAALQLRCGRVLWPICVGPDPAAIGNAVHRFNLVQSLIATDSQVESPLVEAPLIDLTDVDLVRLIDDCRVPPRAFWPCERAEKRLCGSCGGCSRWKGAWTQAGFAWPWPGEQVVEVKAGVGKTLERGTMRGFIQQEPARVRHR